MGITVALEKEDGTQLESVEDPKNCLHRALPAPEDPSFQWAGTIDWYGDTTFNFLQAERLRKEWKQLIETTADPECLGVLRRIDILLDRCSVDRHLYVRFYGD